MTSVWHTLMLGPDVQTHILVLLVKNANDTECI